MALKDSVKVPIKNVSNKKNWSRTPSIPAFLAKMLYNASAPHLSGEIKLMRLIKPGIM
jgi:hypothetical protein